MNGWETICVKWRWNDRSKRTKSSSRFSKNTSHSPVTPRPISHPDLILIKDHTWKQRRKSVYKKYHCVQIGMKEIKKHFFLWFLSFWSPISCPTWLGTIFHWFVKTNVNGDWVFVHDCEMPQFLYFRLNKRRQQHQICGSVNWFSLASPILSDLPVDARWPENTWLFMVYNIRFLLHFTSS